MIVVDKLTMKSKWEVDDEKPFANVTNGREAHPRYWFAVLVKMNTEKKVSEKLNMLGIENYVPIQTEMRQWSDRKKRIERIVIPMIVFVYVDKEEVKIVRAFSSVHKFLSYPGIKEPAIIPNEQIWNLRLMLNNADSKVEISDSIYAIGEEVEIIRGPLKGLRGELCYFEKEKPMVGVHIELLGYACVNVNRNDVKSKN